MTEPIRFDGWWGEEDRAGRWAGVNEVERRLREIEEQLRKAKPPYDLIPCGDPYCDRAFIGIAGDIDNDCGGFRREDAELMTQAPENLRFLLSLLREREEEVRALRHLLNEIECGTDDIREGLRGCGDHSCMVKKPLGMATNGGCRCVTNNTFEVRVLLGRALRKAARLEEENRRLREALMAAAYWYRLKGPCGQGMGELSCGHGGPIGASMCKDCADKALDAALRGGRP